MAHGAHTHKRALYLQYNEDRFLINVGPHLC